MLEGFEHLRNYGTISVPLPEEIPEEILRQMVDDYALCEEGAHVMPDPPRLVESGPFLILVYPVWRWRAWG
jgi:hypothetical protein